MTKTKQYVYRYSNERPDLADVEERLYEIRRYQQVPIDVKLKSAVVVEHECTSECEIETERWGSSICQGKSSWDLIIKLADMNESFSETLPNSWVNS
jgi:hypothetical protein